MKGRAPALSQCLTKFSFRNQSCQSQNQGAEHQMCVFLRATGDKRAPR